MAQTTKKGMSDLDLIKQLEKAVGSALPQKEYKKIWEGDKPGFAVYAADNRYPGRVRGINLSGLNLTAIPGVISSFQHLEGLKLFDNEISDLSPLAGLANLKQLWFDKNQVSDISPLAGLSNLTKLNFGNILGGNQVSDISPLSGLSNLTQLDCSQNQVSDLSPLSGLSNLTQLDCSQNQVSDISPLSGLSNLTKLNFGNILGGNQVSDLSPLSGLANLTKVDFSSNQVSDLSPLAGLANLTKVDFSSNQVSDLSPLARLSNLTDLNLESNQVSDLSPLAGLAKLKIIDAGDNRITSLPPAILDLDLELDVEEGVIFPIPGKIHLKGNPLEQPPPEIIKQGKEAIRAYFRALEEKRLPLQEVKVLLVGDGGAGKTSLVKCLLGKTFDPKEEQTHGINITPWKINCSKRDITVNTWDFGGQEIMHATHQFFLSKRCLYILVLDGRRDEKTEYWLKHIESFGGSSPVLVVLNKIDQHPGFDVNRKFLQEKYPNIKGFFPVSCAEDKGITSLLAALEKELPAVELVNTQWPGSWFKIKRELEQMTDPYISYGQYRTICLKGGVKENDIQDHLLDFLHDLGVILHFSGDSLEDTQVLQPAWATGGVYKIINSKILAENKGVLHKNDLPTILKKTTAEDLEYPKEKFPFITGLMCKFEICYRMDEDRVLIPDLLPVPEPGFDFDYENALRFIVEYDFLPRSVLPRFIVHMYKDIEAGLQWRSGVVLSDPEFKARAAVKADYEAKRIYIYVTGDQRRDYFAFILGTLRSINKSFEKLETKELVPMPDNPKITAPYKQLVKFEKKGYEDYLPAESGKEYRVKDLLGTITEDREKTGIDPKAVEGMVYRILKKIAEERDTPESLAKKMTDIFTFDLNIFGVGINFKELAKMFLTSKKKTKPKSGNNSCLSL